MIMPVSVIATQSHTDTGLSPESCPIRGTSMQLRTSIAQSFAESDLAFENLNH